MDLPGTLHGQLFLLTVDRRRGRFDHQYPHLLGMALRAAMLTDLFLSGHVEDVHGMPRRYGAEDPDDPALLAAVREVAHRQYSSWAAAIADRPERVVRTVCEQMIRRGWITIGRGIRWIGTPRVTLDDEAAVDALHQRVTHALRNTIHGLPADPSPLAVGLLGVLGQLPTVFSYDEAAEHRPRLRSLIEATIEPILGLDEAIHLMQSEERADNLFWRSKL